MAGRPRTRVEREMKRRTDALTAPRQGVDFWSLNGVHQHDRWNMPAPHAPQIASIGGNVHRDLIVKADNRSVSQVIDEMMAPFKK
jgi:hypothetical protein